MPGVAAGESIVISVAEGRIAADLRVPERAIGLVIFAHGSGSSRFSSRNRAVAESLEANGFGTLLLDLLTQEEEAVDVQTREYRFDTERNHTRGQGRRRIATRPPNEEVAAAKVIWPRARHHSWTTWPGL